jgi:hypothetical protein
MRSPGSAALPGLFIACLARPSSMLRMFSIPIRFILPAPK